METDKDSSKTSLGIKIFLIIVGAVIISVIIIFIMIALQKQTLANGAVCETNIACSSGNCAPLVPGAPTGYCQSANIILSGSSGAVCTFNGQNLGCQPGLNCVNGTCQ